MHRFVRTTLDALQRAVTSPAEELTRWQRWARAVYDFVRHGGRHLAEDDAPSMAAALSFRTIFGLLPVLVVATLTAKAFIGNRLPEVVDWVLTLLGATDVIISAGEAGQPTLLADFLKSLVDRAAGLNLAALGWVGGVVLIYSAISLMVTIESSFNRIVRAPAGRPWLKRIPLYWFVLTVGPILLAVTPYLDAKYAEAVSSIASWQWLLTLAKFAWNLAIIWVFIAVIYLWVPNVTLRIAPILVGALVCAVLLEVGKRFLGAYIQGAVVRNPVFGSLGLVPLLMFWIYAMWMVVLFGLEVAAMLHLLRGRQVEELERSRPRGELVDPAGVILVMQAVAERFVEGRPASEAWIVESTGLPSAAVRRMIEGLARRGFVHRVEQADECVSLARPPETIAADELMRVGWELVDSSAERAGRAGIIARLREAQAQFAAGTTLASLAPRGS